MLAALTFHNAHGFFPLGDQSTPSGMIYNSVNRFWPQTILPFIEEGNLLALDPMENITTSNWRVDDNFANLQAVAVYQCPSDTTGVMSVPTENIIGWSRSNYVACYSADGTMVEPGAPQDQDTCNNDPNQNPSVASGRRALFNINVKKNIRQVTDGTSHTIAFSEVIAGTSGTSDVRGYWWGFYGGGVHGLPSTQFAAARSVAKSLLRSDQGALRHDGHLLEHVYHRCPQLAFRQRECGPGRRLGASDRRCHRPVSGRRCRALPAEKSCRRISDCRSGQCQRLSKSCFPVVGDLF